MGVEEQRGQDLHCWLELSHRLWGLSSPKDMMGRLDTLREDMHIVKAKEKAVVDRVIHWLKWNSTQVIRVHNRFLQDRWEKSFEGKVVKSRKKHVEYLLYGETLQFANEFQCIVAEGFPYLPGQSNHGCHGPVSLSNAIGLAVDNQHHVKI
ncbi:hypothetical protein SELMODRAFT_407634 [Selaginella moellendorffii]|uniref:Uncharacterized protein n=1 Tax=Selaginella moellendorffii TaxID=88036 RepID=D8R687_SELML|nr:hypothetical protein SELMODRAFT_407634 [Selaginella moellendorffii]